MNTCAENFKIYFIVIICLSCQCPCTPMQPVFHALEKNSNTICIEQIVQIFKLIRISSLNKTRLVARRTRSCNKQRSTDINVAIKRNLDPKTFKFFRAFVAHCKSTNQDHSLCREALFKNVQDFMDLQ